MKDYLKKSVRDAETIMTDPLSALQILEWLIIGHILLLLVFVSVIILYGGWGWYAAIIVTLVNGFMIVKKYVSIRKNYGGVMHE